MLNKESVAKRLESCQTCEKKITSFLGQKCTACGCLISVKVLFNNAQCPLNKWQTAPQE